MLEMINSPRDLDGLTKKELSSLCEEIRSEIIDVTARRGGHLSSNLGVVETTVALHRVFSVPDDTLIFDVGHQCYTHKLLTGRYERFDTLRTFGGISGFTNKDESIYDFVTAGHSGTALSTALGRAQANKLSGSDSYVVAVIGDGSFTNGETFEALDTCASLSSLRLLIVLNDNEMSISKNVGGLSRYFSRVRASRKYYDFKRGVEHFLNKIPLIGRGLAKATKKVKDFFKRIVVGTNLFDSLGINYLGTVDGDNEARLEDVFREAKRRACPCIVHITTKKGRGYAPAEERPDVYHSVPPFDKDAGFDGDACGFSAEFGRALCALAEKNDKIAAVSAAMTDGTGLCGFAKRFPDRFFDVGIAEEHAATFCAGLALGGYIPIFAVYSTFSQRIFDQLIHDVSLQRAHVVFAVDRAGIVASDGVTHHGIFDVPMMSIVPGMKIYAPDSYDELRHALSDAISDDGPVAVRYPKGSESEYDRASFEGDSVLSNRTGAADVSIVAYSRLSACAAKAAGMLENAKAVRLYRVFPIDFDELDKAVSGSKLIYVLEEGERCGGIGEKLAAHYGERVHIRAVDGFVPHGDIASLDELLGFTPEAVVDEIKGLTGNNTTV